jgi:hypothetical protein
VLAEPDATKRRGCFALNMAAELAGKDLAVSDAVAAYQRGIEDLMTAKLVAAISSGPSTGPSSDAVARIRDRARWYTATLLGIRIMAKADPRSTAIADATRLMVADVRELLRTT